MDVQLYVYDLSRGMARSMSQQFLGTQIDAIYHTSIVVNGVEYFFGQGIQQSRPGATHHGRPMEVVQLGRTQLPAEVILEYLESMKSVYTPEAYDLFQNNCNNFSNDFAQFLVGKDIPSHITSLPETVLNTPFGQMLRPQLDASMRSVTQAPVASSSLPPTSNHIAPATNGTSQSPASKPGVKEHGQVYLVTEASLLDKLLNEAKTGCATIFFTSSTCAPCRLAYPTFDSLAAENPKAIFIKVDINQAHEIGARYQIRATPTFMTFYKGQKQEEWSGADPSRLRSSAQQVINLAFPGHPHASLSVPTLQSGSLRPVTFTKIPPLDKVIAKMGPSASSPAVTSMRDFITARSTSPSHPPSPSFSLWTPFLQSAPTTLPPETLFTALDLFRCLLLDPRVSSHYATESGPSNPTALLSLLTHVSSLTTSNTCPYSLRLVTLQLCSTLFATPLATTAIFTSPLATLFASLAASSLLAEPDKPALRAAAASLAFNLAASNYRIRREEGREALHQEAQTELVAALVEMLGEGEVGGKDGTHAAVSAVGWLVYFVESGGEVADLCMALGAAEVLGGVKAEGKVGEAVRDVGRVVAALG
ncbi:Desumoylating isopeptidase 1 [Elsinoe australis]|uniref:Desumoylating isopeptidase 1 n=1 Tax=Elsinoe australis TaxID=40998 RepID=A0A2P7Z4H5_9PEZI|nr:Desumoylating isopeptidase 1 [Elsinoe australis]